MTIANRLFFFDECVWPINTKNIIFLYIFFAAPIVTTARVECIGTWGKDMRPPGLFFNIHRGHPKSHHRYAYTTLYVQQQQQ